MHCENAVQPVQPMQQPAQLALVCCDRPRSHAAPPRPTSPVSRPFGAPCRPAGFVTPAEQPLLAAIDLPNYNPADPFGQTALTDAIYNSEWGNFMPAGDSKTRISYLGVRRSRGSRCGVDGAYVGSRAL
jgi:hypothetical protein